VSLVAIKGPIVMKLMQGPIAHQGPILVLHSCTPIGVGKRNTYRGQDQEQVRIRDGVDGDIEAARTR
jgi:hypothetical protein